MTAMRATTSTLRRTFNLRWTAGFLAFPVAGLAARAAAGPITDPAAAALGGAVAGLLLGVGQSLAAGSRLDARRWIPATALGLAVGLALAAPLTGYRTTLPALAAAGALTGIPLGLAQALALPPGTRTRRRAAWALAGPPLWALGWTVTTLAGVDVDAHYAVFGATGALTVTLLAHPLLPARTAPTATTATTAAATPRTEPTP
ncbi:hypothetical protein ACGFX4_03290 [Kitasatospora sp. NPDC048365]|uniref:hypothetical protein n=1 Tax=Kitasatospora sp. NPDC048365 TaxID=3364050 RepID=UPI0037216456